MHSKWKRWPKRLAQPAISLSSVLSVCVCVINQFVNDSCIFIRMVYTHVSFHMVHGKSFNFVPHHRQPISTCMSTALFTSNCQEYSHPFDHVPCVRVWRGKWFSWFGGSTQADFRCRVRSGDIYTVVIVECHSCWLPLARKSVFMCSVHCVPHNDFPPSTWQRERQKHHLHATCRICVVPSRQFIEVFKCRLSPPSIDSATRQKLPQNTPTQTIRSQFSWLRYQSYRKQNHSHRLIVWFTAHLICGAIFIEKK